MSIAPRETKCLTCWNTCPGQPARLGQIVHTPPSGLTVGVPQAGHFSGGFGGAERLLALLRLGRGRHDARDHVARAHDDHLVALAHVLAQQVLLVVERGELHRHAAHLHRLEARERDHVARSARRSTSRRGAWWWRSSAGTSRRSRRAARGPPRRDRAGCGGRSPSRRRRRSRSRASRAAPPRRRQAATVPSTVGVQLHVRAHREALLARASRATPCAWRTRSPPARRCE